MSGEAGNEGPGFPSAVRLPFRVASSQEKRDTRRGAWCRGICSRHLEKTLRDMPKQPQAYQTTNPNLPEPEGRNSLARVRKPRVNGKKTGKPHRGGTLVAALGSDDFSALCLRSRSVSSSYPSASYQGPILSRAIKALWDAALASACRSPHATPYFCEKRMNRGCEK